MPTFSRKLNWHSRGAIAPIISRTTRTVKSVQSTTRCCVRATLTHSKSRTLAVRDGIQFASPPRRVSDITSQPSHVLLSLSQTMRTVGMAPSYFSICAAMDARIAGFWLAPQSNGLPLFSSYGIWSRRGLLSQTAIAAPMTYFRRLRFGQMIVQSANHSLLPNPATAFTFSSDFSVRVASLTDPARKCHAGERVRKRVPE